MRILMVDDDSNIINLYSVVLEPLCRDGGFHFAYTPEEASHLIQEKEFDLVISDFDMPPNGTGEEVFNSWIDSVNCKNKFMFFTTRERRELNFFNSNENHYHLPKPATLKKFKNYLKDITKLPTKEYFPIAIYHFARWKKSKVTIYIKINDEKYLKVFNKDEEYDLDRLNTYIDKGKRFLYVKTSDETEFFNEYDYSTIFEDEKSFSFENLKQNHHFLNAQVSMFGLTKQSLKTATDTAENIIHQIEGDSPLYDLLYKSLNSNDYTYDHSYMTICLASFICEQMLIDKKVLTKISTAALLHDVLLPTNRLALIHDTEPEKIDHLESHEIELVSNHNDLGDKLNELDGICNDIHNIIEYHHSGIDQYPIEEHKKEISQLNMQQCIFQASHFVAVEIHKHNYKLSKLSDILTFSQYKYSGKNFDKIWSTLEYIFRHKLN
jgi:response regulator RpfG family c-di-GMP phosphodiesterase